MTSQNQIRHNANNATNWIGGVPAAGATANFAVNSLFEVEIDPSGDSDLLAVSGTVTINGGTVLLLAPTGNYVPGSVYTIITAASVVGEFAGLDTSLAFITPTIEYTGNKVLLEIARNDVTFPEVAITYNQKSVANALQKLSPGDPLYDAVVGQTVAGAQQAFNAMSGEVYGSTASALIDQAHFVRGSIIDRLIQSSYGNAGGEVAALGAGGPIAVAMRSAQPAGLEGRMGLGAANDGTPDVPAGGVPAYGEGLVFWTQAYGSWGQYDGNGNAATLDRSLGGFVSGVDTGLNGNWRAGLATGYTRTDLTSAPAPPPPMSTATCSPPTPAVPSARLFCAPARRGRGTASTRRAM